MNSAILSARSGHKIGWITRLKIIVRKRIKWSIWPCTNFAHKLSPTANTTLGLCEVFKSHCFIDVHPLQNPCLFCILTIIPCVGRVSTSMCIVLDVSIQNYVFPQPRSHDVFATVQSQWTHLTAIPHRRDLFLWSSHWRIRGF